MEQKVTTGSLAVVGIGIRIAGQITPEARSYIEQADKLLFLTADPVSYGWLIELNSTAESLHSFYNSDKSRLSSYHEMVGHILSYVRQGLDVCVASYGHPGVFAYPMHEAIRTARSEGFIATMLPGISAEDCLFADLGVDPGETGCQSFEATDFLVFKRKFDTSSPLILWQVGLVGVLGYKDQSSLWSLSGLRILLEYLQEYYDPNHQVIVYEAAQYPVCKPITDRVALIEVPTAKVTPLSTLYVPPKASASPDSVMIERLGIDVSKIRKM
jgi:uncharacterized protein YabN with tetrapyrrole methylase and pyrophosphatase domain